MCIILVGKVTRELHKKALLENRDGFSIFNENGLIKSPTQKQVQESLGKFGIWHYRIGTSGRKDDYNIHPFEVCKGKYLLYHNGVLGDGVDDMSDTHALADFLYDKDLRTVKSVLRSLSERQRFLLVCSNNCNIFETFGDWSFDSGILMSHKMYTYHWKGALFEE